MKEQLQKANKKLGQKLGINHNNLARDGGFASLNMLAAMLFIGLSAMYIKSGKRTSDKLQRTAEVATGIEFARVAPKLAARLSFWTFILSLEGDNIDAIEARRSQGREHIIGPDLRNKITIRPDDNLPDSVVFMLSGPVIKNKRRVRSIAELAGR